MRSELSTAQRDSAITRRKAIYEQLHPESKHGNPGVSRKVGDKGERSTTERFTKATADAMGVSESTIQNSVRWRGSQRPSARRWLIARPPARTSQR
jgi:ParB family transcriptional regulator, chromosome partitioning protein